MTEEEQKNLLVQFMQWLYGHEKLALCEYKEGPQGWDYFPALIWYSRMAQGFLEEREEFVRTYNPFALTQE